ncbi:DUF5320 domain-containing protein [Solidesulfovibrio sp.]
MPRGDRTGPNGTGSGTGRAMGYCSGAQAPGFASAPARDGSHQGFGQGGIGRSFGQGGFGRGLGRRMGRGGCRGPLGQGQRPADMAGPAQGAATPEMERQDLLRQAMTLESSLEALKARLARLEAQSAQG